MIHRHSNIHNEWARTRWKWYGFWAEKDAYHSMKSRCRISFGLYLLKKKHRERERDTHPIPTHLQMNVIDSLWNDRNDIMAHTTLKESENSKEEICLFPLKGPSESQIPIIFVCMLWAQIALHGVTKVHFSILSPKRIKIATENFHNHNDIAIENSPNVLTSLDSCVSIIHRAMYP